MYVSFNLNNSLTVWLYLHRMWK